MVAVLVSGQLLLRLRQLGGQVGPEPECTLRPDRLGGGGGGSDYSHKLINRNNDTVQHYSYRSEQSDLLTIATKSKNVKTPKDVYFILKYTIYKI